MAFPAGLDVIQAGVMSRYVPFNGLQENGGINHALGECFEKAKYPVHPVQNANHNSLIMPDSLPPTEKIRGQTLQKLWPGIISLKFKALSESFFKSHDCREQFKLYVAINVLTRII
jgi:hypothetical protein